MNLLNPNHKQYQHIKQNKHNYFLTLAFLLFFTFNISLLKALSLKSFKANFSQTVLKDSDNLNSSTNAKITYSGKIYIQNKNIFWDYQKPFVKYIYIKKDKVTTIEPLLEQAIVTKLDEQFNMLKLLKQATFKNKNTLITTLNNIKYTITLKNNLISKITYINEIQNKVQIIFSKQKQNMQIKNNIFKIHIPDSYDVLIR
jgi:outer membrane lipoprotein carrier protein